MNERFVASLTLHHHSDGLVTVTAFVLGVESPVEATRRLEYTCEGPEESTDATDWLRQVLAAATEAC